MIGLTWTGPDGDVWDLRNGPVWITNKGMTGLSMPKFDAFSRDTAERDGQTLTGWKAQPRDVLLPVRVGHSTKTPLEWLDIETRWWKTMRPGRYGRLTATSPDGSTRWLDLRFVDDGDLEFEKDPSEQGAYMAAIRMTADQPFWTGEEFGKEFSHSAAGQNFFGGTPGGKGTPLYVSKRDVLDQAVINNKGDLAVFLNYEMLGPITGFNVGIDGYNLGGKITVGASQRLLVETAPNRQLATLFNLNATTGTNVTRQLTDINFRPIQAGQDLKLNLTLTGNGTIRVIGAPLFFKGWG